MNKLLFLLVLVISFNGFSQKTTSEITWKKVDDGLHLGAYISPNKSKIGDNIVTILKIDPSKYNFNLLSAKRKDKEIKTAKQWAVENKQIAVINAGMYQADFKTNLGFMKDYNFTNNGRLNKDNTIIAFNRKVDSVPEIQIIDRTCQDWEVLKEQYSSFSQSIRMVDCKQKNKWGQQSKKWSMVVVGIDKEGNTLFIFTRSPYSVHDFINILLTPELNIYNIMYLEGGPEASFYLNHNETEVAKVGSYETGFYESDQNHNFWPIPNVIGISKK